MKILSHKPYGWSPNILDSCRDAYPSSGSPSVGISPSSMKVENLFGDAVSPGKQFRDGVFRMLRVVLSHNVGRKMLKLL